MKLTELIDSGEKFSEYGGRYGPELATPTSAVGRIEASLSMHADGTEAQASGHQLKGVA